MEIETCGESPLLTLLWQNGLDGDLPPEGAVAERFNSFSNLRSSWKLKVSLRKISLAFFAIYFALVTVSHNNAAQLNIIFELGADFGHLLFESYLVIEWTNLNRTKWITWPMSWHNFHVLWTNLVKCAHRPWCHQMYRIFIRGDFFGLGWKFVPKYIWNWVLQVGVEIKSTA